MMISLSLLCHTNSSNLYAVYIIKLNLYSVKFEKHIYNEDTRTIFLAVTYFGISEIYPYYEVKRKNSKNPLKNSKKSLCSVLQVMRGKSEGLGNFPTSPVFFIDDGVSGVTFDCPNFNRMIAEIEAGNVETVIGQDMSRLGVII